MKRVLLLLLALTFIVGSFASCKKKPDPSTTTTTPAPQTNTPPTDELSDIEKRALEKDNLPDNLDFEWEEFNTLNFHEMYDIDANGTDNSGDMVTDSIYARNRAVEERLKVLIVNDRSDIMKFDEFGPSVANLISSGNADYDAIYIMGNAAIQAGNPDVFTDIDNLKYISQDAAWWWADAMEQVSYNVNQKKFLVGDICLSGYTRVGTMLVNTTDYAAKFPTEGVDGLYKLVLDRKWTVAELKTRASQAYSDPDGNGVKFTDSNDYLGLHVANPEMVKFLEYGFDVRRFSRNDSGSAVLDYDQNRASTAVDALVDLLFETDGVYYQKEYNKAGDFAQGRTLFQVTWLSELLAKEMREMEDEYTMIPVPMLDSNQKEYTTNIQNSSQMIGVPRTIENTDFSSAVIEALCTESYRKVVLPFYEVALKIRYAKESGVGQMIDIINSVACKNFLYEYQPGGGCGVLITSVVLTEGAEDIGSKYASAAQSTQAYLNQLETKYVGSTN